MHFNVVVVRARISVLAGGEGDRHWSRGVPSVSLCPVITSDFTVVHGVIEFVVRVIKHEIWVHEWTDFERVSAYAKHPLLGASLLPNEPDATVTVCLPNEDTRVHFVLVLSPLERRWVLLACGNTIWVRKLSLSSLHQLLIVFTARCLYLFALSQSQSHPSFSLICRVWPGGQPETNICALVW